MALTVVQITDIDIATVKLCGAHCAHFQTLWVKMIMIIILNLMPGLLASVFLNCILNNILYVKTQ